MDGLAQETERRAAPQKGPHPIQLGEGEQTILIEPLEAFGDGRHPSTRLALRLLDAFLNGQHGPVAPRQDWVLDAGCGTGILALAAALVGGFKVLAVDINPDAIEAAVANLRRNPQPGSRISLVLGDLCCARGPFGLVVANLAPSVHTRARDALWRAVAPGGWLLLSGFYQVQNKMILGYYLRQGAKERSRLIQEGWAGSLLSRPA